MVISPQPEAFYKNIYHKSQVFSNEIIGQSPELFKVIDLMKRIARSDSTALITGETGTGKELVARGIHHYSARSHKPFVAVNCGAIPSEILESELFGHVKGAFTDAVTDRKGRFEMAHGGSIFLRMK